MTDMTRGQRIDMRSRVVIDASYFREQALDAMRTFIAPFHGVYAAATGVKPMPRPAASEPDEEVYSQPAADGRDRRKSDRPVAS